MAFSSMQQWTRMTRRHPRYVAHLIDKKLRLHQRYRWLQRHPDRNDHLPPPLVYRLVLTYKCNLRCLMCYEWGAVGWCKDEPRKDVQQEIDWPALERLFDGIGHNHPSFILIGGEPLLYSRFRELAARLKRHRCFATICTNGLLLDRFFDVIEDNPYLTFLISLDGPADVNDGLRGKGVHDRVVANIRALQALRRPPYIGISFTIRPENVTSMFDFCRQMQSLDVDWVLLNPNWFLSTDQARAYERFMQEHFRIRATTHLGYTDPYPLDAQTLEVELRRIRAARWTMQISCYLKPEDVITFIDRPEAPPRNTFCYKQWIRMDITPDGAVAPCVLYPDLKFPGIDRRSAFNLWNDPDYARFRALRRQTLLPICSKCNAPYLYDPGRKVL